MTEICAGRALGVTELPVPLRQDPQHQSDQVTTALLGTILDGLSQLLEQLFPYYILYIFHI